jgi:aminocarboxymuconate-semialdehyde decarboxylase
LLVDVLGAGRVMLGSDYPYPLGETNAGTLIRTSPLLTDAERDMLLTRNAAAYLGLGVRA